MSSRRQPRPTVDELVSTLKRSSLPTIVIEGCDDVLIFRQLERIYLQAGLSVLPAGGRRAVLDLFGRRSEFERTIKVAFLADQDLYLYSGIPNSYQDNNVIFTEGYSIENDALLDADVEAMLSPSESQIFEKEVALFTRWYSLELSRILSGLPGSIRHHPSRLLDDLGEQRRMLQLLENEPYPETLRERLHKDYRKLLRGKSLLQLITRQLSRRGRSVKHSADSILEFAAVRPGPRISRLFDLAAGQVGVRTLT